MNKCLFVGNLTKDPESTTSNNGISICRFSIAVHRKFAQEGQTDVDFINIVTFRSLADNCNKYLKKGSKVCVVGALQNRSYTTSDGGTRYVTEIIADDVEFLTPKQDTVKTEIKQKQEAMKDLDELERVEIDSDDLPF